MAKERVRRQLAWASLGLLLGFAAGCDGERPKLGADEESRTEIERQMGSSTRAQLDTATSTRLSGAFRAAASEALASVVQIEVVSRQEVPAGPFHPFLQDQQREQIAKGTGSGFIVDSEGHILTNHHVVEGAMDIKVRMVDGREYKGTVVGSDPNSDVAVIQVRPDTTLPVSKLGDSDELKVGDWVLALGSPLGLRFSVTAGIISAFNRNIGILRNRAGTNLEAFIQTDAAINPGNSGGPLVDLMGRVVGINSAIQTESGYSSGAGFAIPINLAKKFAQDLIQYGVVHRPRMGLSLSEVSAADAEIYKLPVIGGVEVQSVTPGEPAARAGIRLGDVLISLNGHRVDGVSDLQSRVAQMQPGETAKVELIRYGARMQVPVRLGEFEPATSEPPRELRQDQHRLGFTVVPLRPDLAARIGRSGWNDVPFINAVNPVGPAEAEQISPGLAVLKFNGREVRVNELRAAEARLSSGDVVSLVLIDPRDPNAAPFIFNYRVP